MAGYNVTPDQIAWLDALQEQGVDKNYQGYVDTVYDNKYSNGKVKDYYRQRADDFNKAANEALNKMTTLPSEDEFYNNARASYKENISKSMSPEQAEKSISSLSNDIFKPEYENTKKVFENIRNTDYGINDENPFKAYSDKVKSSREYKNAVSNANKTKEALEEQDELKAPKGGSGYNWQEIMESRGTLFPNEIAEGSANTEYTQPFSTRGDLEDLGGRNTARWKALGDYNKEGDILGNTGRFFEVLHNNFSDVLGTAADAVGNFVNPYKSKEQRLRDLRIASQLNQDYTAPEALEKEEEEIENGPEYKTNNDLAGNVVGGAMKAITLLGEIPTLSESLVRNTSQTLTGKGSVGERLDPEAARAQSMEDATNAAYLGLEGAKHTVAAALSPETGGLGSVAAEVGGSALESGLMGYQMANQPHWDYLKETAQNRVNRDIANENGLTDNQIDLLNQMAVIREPGEGNDDIYNTASNIASNNRDLGLSEEDFTKRQEAQNDAFMSEEDKRNKSFADRMQVAMDAGMFLAPVSRVAKLGYTGTRGFRVGGREGLLNALRNSKGAQTAARAQSIYNSQIRSDLNNPSIWQDWKDRLNTYDKAKREMK